MTGSGPKWRSLHFYQQVKYVAEILAICGGLFLLGLNVYQVRLLYQSVEINRQLYNSTFPLEVQSRKQRVARTERTVRVMSAADGYQLSTSILATQPAMQPQHLPQKR
jgi:hypothetical protein